MILYGASGHAKVIIDTCLSINKKVVLLFDDNPLIQELDYIKVLTGYQASQYPNEELVISIGDNRTRQLLSKNISHKFATICHSNSYVSSKSTVDEGTVVFSNVTIQPSTMVSKHCIINTKASVDHDCSIGDFVHLAPGATICGGVTIGVGSFIGAGAVVLPNLKIGKWSIIGAGSIVTRNIPDKEIWFGNPAQMIKVNHYED